jgi:hypothetical protein
MTKVAIVRFFMYSLDTRILKKKLMEIIEKKTHLSKVIIINFLKMKKSNQNHG